MFSQGLPTTEVFDKTARKSNGRRLCRNCRRIDKLIRCGLSAAHYSWLQSTGLGNVILPVPIQSADGKLDGYIQLRNAQPFELIVDLEQKSAQADCALSTQPMGCQFKIFLQNQQSNNILVIGIKELGHMSVGIVYYLL